ncbi:MAG: PDZ domain-containing protein [Dehalococcoidia bacterium]|nr:PDZ domain-containing protein [Dehalococcoidia bacterium]
MDDEVVIGFDRGRLQHIIENKIRGKPSFGLKVADATSISLKEKGVPAFGAYVAGVKDGSLATKMGLQTGDIITELNMQPIRNSKDIETAMVRLSRGSRIQIIFQRGGNILKAEGIL